MLAKIAFFMILGKPLVMWMGVLTFLTFATAATIAILGSKGKFKTFNHYAWHIRIARAGLGLAVLHGIMAASVYIN